MAITLFDTQWIVERLKTEVPELLLVGGAADLSVAAESLRQTPAAFVLPSAERASGSSTGTMLVSQLNTVRFAVIVAVQNLRDARGEVAQTDLLQIRSSVMTALHGWQPDGLGDFEPVEFGGGRLLQLTDQVLWWQDEFLTANTIRSL